MPDMSITFERDTAEFIMDSFGTLDRECRVCGREITAKRLGGVVKMGNKPYFICDSRGCLRVWASAK
jgi:hypothetical protein